MTVKINKKIVSYGIKKPEDEAKNEATTAEKAPAEAHGEFRREGNVVHMTETLERPDELIGSTYKVKPPVADHAMYITINDIILNQGTEQEVRRPFEIFINSKNLDHYQWIVALTRVISAVFRKGGDVTFLVEELQAVFDPRGGYWKPGGKFMPSLIAEIGEVIEKHLTKIGMIQPAELDEHQRKLVEQKRAEYEAAQGQKDAFAENTAKEDNGGFPAGAQLCTKCNTAAVVMMDGCLTCLSCGDSKCG
ncbi:TSCPD domain-containing protein [Natronospira bacteriovora]|uniref:ribonucleoside-diphosphate reductase n=1 Tax=Natronospira bacteriovora TaxID=3069753 RepID=A0ABU0W9X0_9GAMM|nr:NrdJb [Natronospira sp. AB-CW4]MDQ2070842.1 NrdJb [Natronospira sp. AB-CW4]